VRWGVLAVVAATAVVAGCGGASREGRGPLRASTHAAPGQASHTTVPEDAIFWNARDGLLEVGECGAAGHSCTGSGVELTTDGGHSYHLILPTRDRKDRLETVGPRGAAIDPPTSSRTARLTLDRGRTWKKAPYDYRITWATPRIGLRTALGKDFYSVNLSATHDGGKTWQRLPSVCQGVLGPLPFASLPTPSRWWLTCQGQPEQGGPPDGARELLSTIDAGRNWTLVASTADGTLPASAGGPVFAPDGFGFLFGYPTAFVTSDGGKTSTKLPAGLIPVAAFNGGVGYALERGNPLPVTLLETRDSGRTWHAVQRWRG
jgi:photosystem II stability/assembly factor-like uncharacterized protein